MIVVGNKINLKPGEQITTEYRDAVIAYTKMVLEKHKQKKIKHGEGCVNASKRLGRTTTYIYYSIDKNVFNKEIVILKISGKHLGFHGYKNEVLDLSS